MMIDDGLTDSDEHHSRLEPNRTFDIPKLIL